MSSRPPCRFFNGKPGSCRKGNACTHSHNLSHDRVRMETSTGAATGASTRRSREPCKHFFERGSCSRGDDCRFAHIAQPGHAVLPLATSTQASAALATSYTSATRALLQSPALASRGSLTLAAPEAADASHAHFWHATVAAYSRPFSNQNQATLFCQSLLNAVDGDAEAVVAVLGGKEKRDQASSLLDNLLTSQYSVSAGSDKSVFSFQRALVPLVVALASNNVACSPMHVNVSGIYAMVAKNAPALTRVYSACVQECFEQGSVEDPNLPLNHVLARTPSARVPLSFVQIILPLVRCLYALLQFFPTLAYEPWVAETVDRLGPQLLQVQHNVTPASIDNGYACRISSKELDPLLSIVNKARKELHLGILDSAFEQSIAAKQSKANRGHPWNSVGNIPLLPAGTAPTAHSNDHLDIKNISVIPTQDEITSLRQPALPGNFQTTQQAHWLAPGPERLLDTHFRLLREDLVRPVRANINGFLAYLTDGNKALTGFKMSNNRLRGTINQEQIDVNVYSGVQIGGFEIGNRSGLCARVLFDAPTALKGSKSEKTQYWKRSGRLEFGMLVVLVFQETEVAVKTRMEIVFGIVAERNVNKMVDGTCEILVQIPPMFLTDALLNLLMKKNGVCAGYLIEANQIMFEGYRPVLEALQKLDPSSLPFRDLICPATEPERDSHGMMVVPPPLYATAPAFFLDLTPLCKSACEPILLVPESGVSRNRAIKSLQDHSTLDAGQARALVAALSSELSCIQGPPGTGKSYVGVQAVVAMLHNKAKVSPTAPILLICFTNHALDQFVTDLLDSGIEKIVRLGNSSDPRIEPLLLKNAPKSENMGVFSVRRVYQEIEECKAKLEEFNKRISKKLLHWKELDEFLSVHNYEQYESFLEGRAYLLDQESDGFRVMGGRGKVSNSNDLLGYWLDGGEIDRFGEREYDVPSEGGLSDSDGAHAPPAWRGSSRTARPLDVLLEVSDVWELSKPERFALLNHWKNVIPSRGLLGLKSLQKKVASLQSELEGCYRERDAAWLRSVNIIAATTTGAAKFNSLIQSVGPKIIVCEEAGEVLEAHSLAAMHPDTQQLVLIGDHLQLRPRIAVHELSSESSEGRKYRLDMSLFERLQEPETKFPLQTLDVQRRMRPDISDFARTILYPDLKDSENVKNYPSVLGIRNEVFFVNHANPQDKVDASAKAHSHSNTFESEYCVALVRYLLRQGYAASDVVVLTPYVGQLMQLRDKLGSEMMVLISEKDVEMLDSVGDDDDGSINPVDDSEAAPTSRVYGSNNGKLSVIAQRVSLKQAIRVSTIDNFQGEEAKIIVISLVRNGAMKGRDSIGFLKTSNRINVLLSRAKHGMYLIGNEALLASKSETWKTVLDLFHEKESIGAGLPIFCVKHPDVTHCIEKPDEFVQFAPHGGCSRPCGIKLHACGHVCPQRCHSDDPEHKAVYCHEDCPRLHSNCGHPCVKRCGDDCGNCLLDARDVVHPSCGHVIPVVPCHVKFNPTLLGRVLCQTLEEKELPCGHVVRTPCHRDPETIRCPIPCNQLLPCDHPCQSTCGNCLKVGPLDLISPFRTKTVNHAPCKVACTKTLPCRHVCKKTCPQHEQGCPPCSSPCDLVMCNHAKCAHKCGDPCKPCQTPCAWSCEHQASCPLVCGAPCTRLPCDKRCAKLLACGHQCPTVCGETCPSVKFCQECGEEDVKEQVVDMVCFEEYYAIDLDTSPICVLKCGHVFTIETLDGTLGMSNVYHQNAEGEWSLADVPADFVDLPVCPNCKTRIICVARYGRVLNLAVSKTAEKSWISQVSTQLNTYSQRLSTLSANTLAKIDNALGPAAAIHRVRLAASFNAKKVEPLLKPLKDLKPALDILFKMCMQAPQRLIYEASVAHLAKLGWSLEDAAIHLKQSLPRPHASFCRKSAALVCQWNLALSLALVKLSDAAASKTLTDESKKYIHSALTHLDTAIGIARAALRTHRSSTRVNQFNETSEFELGLLQFELLVERVRVQRKLSELSHQTLSDEQRTAQLFDVKFKWGQFKLSLSPSFSATATVGARVAGLDKRILDLEQSGSVSTEEMKLVVEAMAREFSVSGHWYQCQNGHPFTIGECGQAMQESVCPECGAPIGGHSHRLNPNNRQFDPLEGRR
ncbi:hypothetical protein HDU98_002582 [Podochytrium sp. JEL0797]|nr:hypothetical protein HDU98_002582 [Podochytrium sp. JEL0797]